MALLTLALLLVGLGLLVAEAHLPSFGLLGAAGVAALVGGIVLALVGAGGGVALALGLALPVGVAAAAISVVAVSKARAAQRRRPRGGAEALVGRLGVVRQPLQPQGQILVDGALWRARRSWADDDDRPPPAEGEAVVVDHVQGLTLSVRRAEEWEVER